MLYEGVVRFLQQAKDASLEGKLDERYNKLSKSSEVIIALQGSLDFEQGGEPAQVLYEFYSQLYRKINDAHRADASDISHIESIIHELKEMRDVWDQIDRGENATKTAASQAEQIPPSEDQTEA